MFSIRLPKDLEKRIDDMVQKNRANKSEIVRKTMQDYLVNEEEKEFPYKLGEDLFGRYGSGDGNFPANCRQKVKEKIREKALIDTSPCTALFDRDDRYHRQVKSFMQSFRGRLLATWPIVTETLHMLAFNQQVQLDFMCWLKKGALEIASLCSNDLVGIIKLTEKYTDRPMDLADAILLITADREQVDNTISIDSDFNFFRTISGRHLTYLLLENSLEE